MISFLSKRLFSTLVIAEHKGLKLNSVTSKILSAAVQLNQETHVLLLGHKLDSVLKECQENFCSKCFQKIYVADHNLLEHNLSDISEHVLKHLITQNKYTHILTSSSTTGKDLIPRIAASFDSQPITDVISIIDKNTFQRPIYAGNALCTVKSNETLKFLTIRGTSFEPRNISQKESINSIEKIDVQKILDSADNKSNFSIHVSDELVESDRPELTSAKIVVSGGRGLKSKENFVILEKLAKTLNAAVGASRAAVDAGYVSNDLQVGQTGKVVAPDLYIAVGISGAIQHLAGMKDSKVIVAINKDPDAPIFQVNFLVLIIFIYRFRIMESLATCLKLFQNWKKNLRNK